MSTLWWELADVGGNLDRRIPGAEWYAPRTVELVEGGLGWQGKGPLVRPRAGMLERFLTLAAGSDDDSRTYSARWGILGICKHGLPFGLPPHEASGKRVEWCLPLRWRGFDPPRGPAAWEPIQAWRDLSEHAGSLIKLAANLHRDVVGRPEDISRVRASAPKAVRLLSPDLFSGSTKTVSEQRSLVARFLREWLWIAGVKVDFQWTSQGPQIGLGGLGLHFGLFGALIVQLVLVVSNSEGMAFCSSCGQPYIPKRRPKSRQRSYCPSCGHKAAVRDAVRAHRDRRAFALDLYRRGTAIARIVREVGTAESTVRRWVKAKS